ncbi:hypothetical protein [Haloterrigena salifodinae]|uniref:hypothetical protein n=1 Tax=Haloterrigena salifodinae TaxID=2675099 RepID=UPI000F89232C|nr:hypothetical protein [Haloterrigena salifodinae]
MTFDLPEAVADSWRPLGTRTGETSAMLASITAETTVYERVAPAAGVDALEASDIPARSLFVVDVTVSPSPDDLGLSTTSVFSKAAPKARDQFVDTLESEGLAVEGTRNSLEFEASNGNGGSWYVLDVGYPVDGETSEEPDRIDAEAHVAVWPLESTFGMAGGVLPLEDGVRAETADSASSNDELGTDPERDRETIAQLIRTVDFDDNDESDDS